MRRVSYPNKTEPLFYSFLSLPSSCLGCQLTLTNIVIHIDVKDTALLHVAAVLDPECNGTRLQAWSEYCNINDILAILRRLYPERKFMDDLPKQGKLSVTADYDQQLALLKKWGGQVGWTPLEKTVADEARSVSEWFPDL